MNEPSTFVASAVAFIFIIVGPIIGLWTARLQSHQQGHSESSIRFGTFVTGLSAAASGNSAFILVGAVGLGFVMGVSALWIAFGYWIGDIIFWYFLAEKLIKRVQETGVDTISELIAHQSQNDQLTPLRIGAVVAIFAVGLFCIAQFFAVGKIAAEIFNIGITHAIALALTAGVLSILLGGLGSSMLVNVYHSLLMISAAAVFVVFTVLAIAGDFGILTSAAESKRLLDPFYGFSGIALIGFVFTFILQGLLFAMCNPHVLSRITKGNIEEIPRIRWVYMGFMQSLWWLMTLAGVALGLLGLSVADPDGAGIIFAGNAMPPAILGLFIAGIIAASLSTGEAQLLIIANSLVMDLAPDRFNALSAANKKIALTVGRVIAAIGLFVALVTLNLDMVGQIVIQAASLLLSAFAIPAFFFMFKLSIDGRIMGLIILVGGGITLLTRIIYSSLPPSQEIYPGLFAAAIVASIGLIARRRSWKQKR